MLRASPRAMTRRPPAFALAFALALAPLIASGLAAPNPTNCSNAGGPCGACGPGCEWCGPPLAGQFGAPQYHIHDYSCAEKCVRQRACPCSRARGSLA
jgi:hypothetical protein